MPFYVLPEYQDRLFQSYLVKKGFYCDEYDDRYENECHSDVSPLNAEREYFKSGKTMKCG